LRRKNTYLALFLKSIPIGLANTLPGVSGGTIALVLNIYETLINAIKDIKIKKLSFIGLGAVFGVFVGSAVITDLYASNPLIVNYFLFGLVITSAHSTYKKIGSFSFLKLLFMFLAFGLALFFSREIQLGFINAQGLMLFFIAGFFGSIAMILPGISGGTLLILMGVYHPILAAVNNFEIITLTVFALGMGAGLLVFAWLFSYLLKKHQAKIMVVLTGLILGSSAAVFPARLELAGFIAFAAGAILIIILEIIGKNT
jgi:putative membrane protein